MSISYINNISGQCSLAFVWAMTSTQLQNLPERNYSNVSKNYIKINYMSFSYSLFSSKSKFSIVLKICTQLKQNVA